MTNTENKKPSHYAYIVREGNRSGADFWTKVGVAFAHNDGKGFSVLLEAIPIDGKLTIRVAEPKDRK